MPPFYLLVIIISAVWILSEVGLVILRRSSKTSYATHQKGGSPRSLWLTVIPCITIGVFWSFQTLGFIKSARLYIIWFGLALIILGLIIRWIAIYTLRKYFTVDVAIFKDHKVIKSGFYKSIRHPAYAGGLVSFFGLGWALGNWVSFIIIFFPILFAFIRRINIEEKTLVLSLGEEYREYMRKTKRLIPSIY
jgi:protein-S-isoprenylcysteine O-methyltransferase Ste14